MFKGAENILLKSIQKKILHVIYKKKNAVNSNYFSPLFHFIIIILAFISRQIVASCNKTNI